jgi:hypothetical protein
VQKLSSLSDLQNQKAAVQCFPYPPIVASAFVFGQKNVCMCTRHSVAADPVIVAVVVVVVCQKASVTDSPEQAQKEWTPVAAVAKT